MTPLSIFHLTIISFCFGRGLVLSSTVFDWMSNLVVVDVISFRYREIWFAIMQFIRLSSNGELRVDNCPWFRHKWWSVRNGIIRRMIIFFPKSNIFLIFHFFLARKSGFKIKKSLYQFVPRLYPFFFQSTLKRGKRCHITHNPGNIAGIAANCVLFIEGNYHLSRPPC